ncbi:MAG: class II aldolase/adducin family protein [Halodesulfurarchaeum sp.]
MDNLDSTEDDYRALRSAVADGVVDIADLTPGQTGNLSARDGERLAITPSGVPYAEIERGDVPVVGVDGERLVGDLEPSSELAMHLELYRALQPGAIVHVHAPYSTTLAVERRPVPSIHYMLAAAGGAVPVAPYEPFGTPELAEAVSTTMEEAGTTACLLANHGLVATGEDVSGALETAIAVESTARLAVQADDPVELSDEQLSTAIEQFTSYGQGVEKSR